MTYTRLADNGRHKEEWAGEEAGDVDDNKMGRNLPESVDNPVQRGRVNIFILGGRSDFICDCSNMRSEEGTGRLSDDGNNEAWDESSFESSDTTRATENEVVSAIEVQRIGVAQEARRAQKRQCSICVRTL